MSIASAIPAPAPVPTPVVVQPPFVPQPKRWTVAEFHTLYGQPWCENRKLILVEGDILEMPNPNPPHDMSMGLTEAALRAVFGTEYWVRGQMALIFGGAYRSRVALDAAATASPLAAPQGPVRVGDLLP